MSNSKETRLSPSSKEHIGRRIAVLEIAVDNAQRTAYWEMLARHTLQQNYEDQLAATEAQREIKSLAPPDEPSVAATGPNPSSISTTTTPDLDIAQIRHSVMASYDYPGQEAA